MAYEATRAALARFDRLDPGAEDFMRARRDAADQVRAAWLADTRGINTPDMVEVLPVDRIRKQMNGCLLGRLLSFLP